MTIIQISVAASALIIGFIALYFFNKRAIDKHNFAFFTIASFIMATISLGMMIIGYRWFVNATPNSDDIMNGIGMGVIGVIVGSFLIITNAAKTSALYAITGLLILFLILGALLTLGNAIF